MQLARDCDRRYLVTGQGRALGSEVTEWAAGNSWPIAVFAGEF